MSENDWQWAIIVVLLFCGWIIAFAVRKLQKGVANIWKYLEIHDLRDRIGPTDFDVVGELRKLRGGGDD